jgi:hypothetical protein
MGSHVQAECRPGRCRPPALSKGVTGADMISRYRHNQSHNSQPHTLSKSLSTAVPLCSVLHACRLCLTHTISIPVGAPGRTWPGKPTASTAATCGSFSAHSMSTPPPCISTITCGRSGARRASACIRSACRPGSSRVVLHSQTQVGQQDCRKKSNGILFLPM